MNGSQGSRPYQTRESVMTKPDTPMRGNRRQRRQAIWNWPLCPGSTYMQETSSVAWNASSFGRGNFHQARIWCLLIIIISLQTRQCLPGNQNCNLYKNEQPQKNGRYGGHRGQAVQQNPSAAAKNQALAQGRYNDRPGTTSYQLSVDAAGRQTDLCTVGL